MGCASPVDVRQGDRQVGCVKTLATYVLLQDADLLRTRLEAAGIPAFLPQESEGSADAFPGVITGYRVQVPEDRWDEAREILRDRGSPQGPA